MTDQLNLWKSDFGNEYISRNPINKDVILRLTRDWGRMLSKAISPSPNSVLEVGCNIGRNLAVLNNFISELHGIEPNAEACKTARQNPKLANVNILEGDGFNLPFSNESVDLVFTSGVLIHVSPDDLDKFVDEIYRVSRRYILVIEYFSHTPVSIPYRGLEGYLFKRDFGSYYLDRFPSLRPLDYGFLWQRFDSSDNSNWWLFAK